MSCGTFTLYPSPSNSWLICQQRLEQREGKIRILSMQFLIGKKTDKKCRKNHNWQLIVLFVIVSVAGASSVRIVGHVTVTNGNIYQTFTTIYIFCGKWDFLMIRILADGHTHISPPSSIVTSYLYLHSSIRVSCQQFSHVLPKLTIFYMWTNSCF